MIGLLRTRTWSLAVGLACLLLIGTALARPSFVEPSAWAATIAGFAPFALASMASTPQILSGGGGIDISIGPLLNFVGVIIVGVLIPHGLGGPATVIPAALCIGIVVGVVNGVLVGVFRYLPVLATLGTFFILQGAGLSVLSEPASSNVAWLDALGGSLGPIPGGLVLIVVAVLIWIVLGRIGFLKALYAVGGDDAAAYSAGVRVAAVRVGAYALGGLFAALAGIALVATIQEADPSQSTQYTLPALAAVAIGGTSFLGGRGGITGAIAGAAVMYLIQELLDALSVSSLWVQPIDGLFLMFAVAATALTAIRFGGLEDA